MLAKPLKLAAITLAIAGSAFASDDHGHAPSPKPAPAHAAPKPVVGKPMAKPTNTKPAANAPASISTIDTNDKPAAEASMPPNADGALKLLQEGNARWVSGATTSPNVESSRRAMLAENGQKPFVTVLTCADSRLPVERLFDRGVGDVFTVRVAGNVAGTSETGTIEYGVEHLKTPLLVVMGHTKCGAVAAAASGAEVHGAVAQLVNSITPAVERAKRNNPTADQNTVVNAAVKENVWQTIFDLIKYSPDLRTAMKSGQLKVVGAVCDVATGKVEFLGEHPWQGELVDAMSTRERSIKSPATATATATEPDAAHE